MIPFSYFLIIAIVLFSIGIIGALVRKNVLMILMSIELMLNAANLTLLTFARMHQDVYAQTMSFFIVAIAAAEAAVGLAIVVGVFRKKKSIYVEDLKTLQY